MSQAGHKITLEQKGVRLDVTIDTSLIHYGLAVLDTVSYLSKGQYYTGKLWVGVGFGIDQLRDDCMDTYWQSDGQLPHLVNIQFQRKTMVSHIYIYTDYKLDESYTPSRVSVRAGTHFNDLQEIEVIELIEPTGMPKYIYTNGEEKRGLLLSDVV